MDTDAGQALPATPERRKSDSIALSAFFDGHPVATFAIDTDHVITHWNSACEQLLGFTAAEMVGTRDHWKAFYPQPRACLA
ncbi:MAG: PAS domain-containing protein, partial [Janthinobacterium sp.]